MILYDIDIVCLCFFPEVAGDEHGEQMRMKHSIFAEENSVCHNHPS